MINDTTTIRVWEKSPIIGKTVKQIKEETGVLITSISRGRSVSDNVNNIVDANDFITFTTTPKQTVEFERIVDSED